MLHNNSKVRKEQKETYLGATVIWAHVAATMFCLQPVAALAGVEVGFRVVMTVHRHGVGVFSVHGGSILFAWLTLGVAHLLSLPVV
jgi:hypothetical protein